VKCIIVSLASRPDRGGFMSSQESLANCSFFPAAVVDEAGEARFRRRSWVAADTMNLSRSQKRNLLGLLESHLRVLDHFHAAQPPPRALLVFEDDAQVSTAAFAFIRELLDIDWSGTPWDVIRLKFQNFDNFAENYQNAFRAKVLAKRYRSRVLDADVYCYSAQTTDRSTYNVLYRGSSLGRVAASLRKAALTSFDSMLLRASKSSTDGFSSLYCVVRSPTHLITHIPWMLRSSIATAADSEG
jgi:hypothetical protein